jgi:VanZ family protein
MQVDSRRSRLIAITTSIAALYWVSIFVATHLPIKPTPLGIPGSFDKVEHVVAFAGLAGLLCIAGTCRSMPRQPLFAAVLGLIALYGMFDEFTQLFVPRRSFEMADWMADMLGAAIGVTAFSLIWDLTPAGRRASHLARQAEAGREL